MELQDAIQHRRMVRSFEERPVEPSVLSRIVACTDRGPSAGNTRGTAWISLIGSDQTERYWKHATTPDWRQRSNRWPGLSRAPVILLSLCHPSAYVARYGEEDKAGSGLGPVEAGEGGMAAWPVPYWFGDAAFETMLTLLAITDEGLGGCFLGNFRGEAALLGALGVPPGWRLFGAILAGHPDGQDQPSPSVGRSVPPSRVLHAGRW